MSEPIAEGSESTESIESTPEKKAIADTSNSIDRVALGSYFEIVDMEDPHTIEKLDTISNWVENTTKKDDNVNLLWSVKQISEEMGMPPMGMDRLTQIYQWVKIDNQINNLQNEKKAYEK